jgi:hypothetical protein
MVGDLFDCSLLCPTVRNIKQNNGDQTPIVVEETDNRSVRVEVGGASLVDNCNGNADRPMRPRRFRSGQTETANMHRSERFRSVTGALG